MKTYARKFYDEVLTKDPMWDAMAKTVEDSPYHREANTKVHTNMVVDQYFDITSSSWDKSDVHGFFTVAFHDTGKPAAEETIHNHPVRGTYRRYSGHEVISARLWEDWAMSNRKVLYVMFDLNTDDLFIISYMIEHHLPYDLKDGKKIANLKSTIDMYCNRLVFCNILQSDCWGRISDDHNTKKAKVAEWCNRFIVDN